MVAGHDGSGRLLWKKSYEENGFLKTQLVPSGSPDRDVIALTGVAVDRGYPKKVLVGSIHSDGSNLMLRPEPAPVPLVGSSAALGPADHALVGLASHIYPHPAGSADSGVRVLSFDLRGKAQWQQDFLTHVAAIDVAATAGHHALFAGAFRDSVDWGPLRSETRQPRCTGTETRCPAVDPMEAFLVALDASGGVRRVRTFPSSTAGSIARAVTSTQDGGIVMAGDFEGALNLRNGHSVCATPAGTSTCVHSWNEEASSCGYEPRDIWIAKLNDDLQTVWSVAIGGDGQDQITGLHADPTGVVLSGIFRGQFDLRRDPTERKATAIVVKLAPNGHLKWSHQLPLRADPLIEGPLMTTDEAGRVYLVYPEGEKYRLVVLTDLGDAE